MSQRGVYGKKHGGTALPGRTFLGATPPDQRGSSIGTWILGGLVLGGAVLWAKNQSDQLEKLYTESDLPYQSFPKSLRLRAGELSAAAGERLHGLAQRLGTRKLLSAGPRNSPSTDIGRELDDGS